VRLALRELRRRPGRFIVATALLTLVALLLLLLGGLLDGLVQRQTGAILAQRADAVVYSATSEQSFLRSRVDASIRSKLVSVDGVSAVGGIGVVQLGGRVPGRAARDLIDVALFGYELAPMGVPDVLPADGEGYGDAVLRELGVRAGMTIALGPARTPIKIVGFVGDARYEGQASVWASPATWRAVASANRPSERLGDGVFQAFVVRGSGGAALPARLDAATAGATKSLTIAAAADAQPGVKQQKATFTQIIGVTLAIATVVVALFFALLTVERAGLYGVLKAIGASTRTLFAGIISQAVAVTALAAVIAAAIAVVFGAIIPADGVPFTLYASRLIGSVVALIVASVVGCAFSLRRVLRVDPASAIGSSS